MSARLVSIYRHPVKGFTPEPLDSAELAAGEMFPCDRLYAVENGPCGYDRENPVFIPKQKFTVLAAIPEVARARTAYDAATGTLHAEAPGLAPFEGSLETEQGRTAFAAWLGDLLGEEAKGPLRVLRAAERRPFTDHPQGAVSLINLASLKDLGQRLGREIDPRRFRANLVVDGWPAWAELGWVDRELSLGGARARVFKPIVRCAATFVNPDTAVRDIEMTKALFDLYGHLHCGIYLHVTQGGRLSLGDVCEGPA